MAHIDSEDEYASEAQQSSEFSSPLQSSAYVFSGFEELKELGQSTVIPEGKNNEIITLLHIKNMIKDQSVKAVIYPLLLTFGGLPQSGKSTALQNILWGQNKEFSASSFSQHQLIASGFKSSTRKIRFAETQESPTMSLFYGILSGFHQSLLLNEKVPSFNTDYTAMDGQCQFKDKILTSTIIDVHNFLRHHFEPRHVRTLEKALPSGIAFCNIWELAVSRTILRFLECFRGYLYNNYTWLFLDLDRDVPNLHLPPDTQGATMLWRSRLHYLLRSSCLSEDLRFKRVKVCKIFAVHSGKHQQENLKAKMQNLNTRCKNAAEQAGLSHLFDFDVISINRNSSTLQTEFLEKVTQLLQQEVQQADIPISWIFLCSSLQVQESIFLTHTDLEKKAKECGITQDNLPKFVKFFTSFGYIFDIKLVDDQSEYIIVKPVEFLKKLNVLVKPMARDVSTFGVLSLECAKSCDMFGEDANIFLDVLTSVGLAAKVPSCRLSAVDDFTAPVTKDPSFYYIAFARLGEPKTECHPGAVQMISSMQAPGMNMQIAFASELLNCLPHSMFVPVKEMNVTAIQARLSKGPIEIEIVGQGDVIELLTKPNGNDEDMDIVCSSIVKAAHNIALKRAKRGGEAKYHFAVVCASDDHQKISYNIHHRRHILSNKKLCPKCCQNDFFDKQIHPSWNKALQENQIEHRFKLNGELSQDDVMMVAKEISSYSDEAIEVFRNELHITLLKGPKIPKWWIISNLIMDWIAKREGNEEEESSKKALARKLLVADSKINKSDDSHPKFKMLARSLDIQVFTEEQVKDVQNKITRVSSFPKFQTK